MKLKKAEHCAWRGRYLYTSKGTLVARATLDPNHGIAPNLRIALPLGWYRSCAGDLYPRLREIRIPMPWVRYRPNMGRLRSWLYQKAQWFWHKMDGRYGWGSKRDN